MKLKHITLSISALLFAGTVYSSADKLLSGTQDSIFGKDPSKQFTGESDSDDSKLSQDELYTALAYARYERYPFMKKTRNYTKNWFIIANDTVNPNSIWSTFAQINQLDLIYLLNLGILQQKEAKGLVKENATDDRLTKDGSNDWNLWDLINKPKPNTYSPERFKKTLGKVLGVVYAYNGQANNPEIAKLKTIITQLPAKDATWTIKDEPVISASEFDKILTDNISRIEKNGLNTKNAPKLMETLKKRQTEFQAGKSKVDPITLVEAFNIAVAIENKKTIDEASKKLSNYIESSATADTKKRSVISNEFNAVLKLNN